MKQLFLTLAIALFGYSAYAQWSSGSGKTTTTDNIGIGISDPGSTKLVIAGSGAMQNLTNQADQDLVFSLTTYGATDKYALIAPSTSTNLAFGVANTEKMRITASGNVGIGTTSPSAKLEVLGSIRNSSLLVKGAQPGIDLTNTSTSAHSWNIWSVGPSETWTNGSLAFYDETANQYRFGIDNNGNVGIGTTSPLTALHIQGAGTSGSNLSVLTLTNNIPGSVGNAASIDFNPTSDLGSIYSRIGSIMEATSKAGVYISTYNPSTGFGERLRVDGLGNVGIGTTDPHGYKLAVNGSAIATSMTVKLYADWPDYVFKPKYHLLSLATVKAYIDKNQHLPDMPSEKEVKDNGINLGEIVKVQTKKIEELTLYLIDKDKQVNALQDKVTQQDARMKALEAVVAKLTANNTSK